MASEVAERKELSAAEFRGLGYLQESNRQFFHPHGLALAVRVVSGTWANVSSRVDVRPWMAEKVFEVSEAIRTSGHAPMTEDGRYVDGDALNRLAETILERLYPQGSASLGCVWDCRDDPEGIVFADLDGDDRERAEAVRDERLRHYSTRAKLFGAEDYIGLDRLPSDPRGLDVEPFGFTLPKE